MPGEYFDIVLFAGDQPIKEKRYELVLPKDKRLHAENYNGAVYSSVTYDAETTTHAWWCKDMPARAHGLAARRQRFRAEGRHGHRRTGRPRAAGSST